MDSEKQEEQVPGLYPSPRLSNASSPRAQGAPLSKTKSATGAALAKVASHLTTKSITNPGPPPDGGLLAWTQVFCAWLAILNTWGFVNSFGAFQTHYTAILPQTPSTISWIGSTQACLLFVVGMFSGRAFDAGLFRPTIIIGIAIQIVGIFTMSAAKNFWQLLLTQGICTGIGGGIFFVPIMSLCSTYFAKRRGMAIGIVTSGNSAGGIIYPIVVRELLGKVGFGWTVRVLGFINVISLAIVIAFMKPRLPPRKTGPLIDMDAFRDPPYLIHILGVCFLMPPVYYVFYYVASFAREELGMPYTTSLNLVIILNGVGIPARVLPGFIADHYVGALNTFFLCIMGTMVIFWSWLGVNSISGYYIFITMYGLFSASFQSLFPTTIAALSNDITKTGTRLGMAFTAIGFSALVGGPIAGALVKSNGGYIGATCWASVSTLIGGLLVGTARVWKHGWRWKMKC